MTIQVRQLQEMGRMLKVSLPLLTIFAFVPNASATDNTRKELAVLATNLSNNLKAALDKTNVSIAVRDFVFDGKANARITTGPKLKGTLIKELEAIKGVKVDEFADHYVDAKFSFFKDNVTGHLAIRITGSLKGADGRVIADVKREVFGLPDLVDAAGITGSYKPNATRKERNRQAERILEASTTVRRTSANGLSRVFASADSPYGIEILVEERGRLKSRAVKVTSKNDAFLEIKRDEIYAVRLINNSKHDAAVRLSIDGLSLFEFSQNKNYTHMIVPAGKSSIIKGWHRTNLIADAFQVTEYSKSAAGKEFGPKKPASVGTITAIFRAAWEGDDPPLDEATRSSSGTGFGPPRKQNFKEVRRFFGVMRASVSVRYLKR